MPFHFSGNGQFTTLTDSPDDYIGFANFLIGVNATQDGVTYIDPSTVGASLTVDTQANIVASTPSGASFAYATDVQQFYIYDGSNWYESASYFNLDTSAPDIGLELNSNKEGYGRDYISDKVLNHCAIGDNQTTTRGGLRFITGSNGQDQLQIYRDGEWQAIPIGINIKRDETGSVYDIEFTDYTGFEISLITGDSDKLDPSGLPIVQQMGISMGPYQAVQILNGGSF